MTLNDNWKRYFGAKNALEQKAVNLRWKALFDAKMDLVEAKAAIWR